MIEFIDPFLNPVLGWLLDVPPILALLFLSLVLGLFSTLLQKYMTNQRKMKNLKDETKKMQKQMKEYQKKKQEEKMMKVQAKMMPLQMDLMKESFKPLIVTMIPFLVIFFWLSNHFAFYPILPEESFEVNAEFAKGVSGSAMLSSETLTIATPEQEVAERFAKWDVTGPLGTHSLVLSFAGAEFTRDVLITTERKYSRPEEKIKGTVKSFNVANKKLLPMGESFNLFGWYPGWIFYYIIFSIPVSLGLKKLLKVV
ncbi:MAG: EMC3/TMCO1 family protein [Candidatus Woesearchaeota archaeon]|nr:EMC3/TMCO1 family protein [Candidatus Woesearchaeota archaeon]